MRFGARIGGLDRLLFDYTRFILVLEKYADQQEKTNSTVTREKRLQIQSPTEKRSIPYERAWKIAFRTLHLVAISILVGGHAFGASADQLRPLLYGAIVTGVGMATLEAYPSLQFIHQGWGLFLLLKLALLCTVPFMWSSRLPILIAVIIIGSVGSHMPRKFRHYSLINGPERKE